MSATVEARFPDGARVAIQPLGGQILSWIPAGGDEQLFMAANARPGEKTVKGGVPVMFPQFADAGPLPLHGFARDLLWEPAGAAAFALDRPGGWGPGWPHPFHLLVEAQPLGASLRVTLTVRNTGARRWFFSGGLHTYLAVNDIGAVSLEGLAGRRYRDKTRGHAEFTQAGDLAVTEETDRIYPGAGAARLLLREPGRTVAVAADGFDDVVVWNPWQGAEQRFPQLGPGDYRRMLCVEAAVVDSPPTLGPGAVWQGSQTLTWSRT